MSKMLSQSKTDDAMNNDLGISVHDTFKLFVLTMRSNEGVWQVHCPYKM